MHKRILLISLLATSLFFCTISFAETILLKSGKTVEGRIIEKTDKYIKIDVEGVPLTYFLNEVESVVGQKINSTSGDGILNQPEKASEEKNIKADKGFGAQLWLTDDMEFVKKWNTPGAGVQLKKVNIAERGKPIQVITFFANPGVDARGLCDISSEITVYAPDRSVYGELKDVKCWKDLPAPPPGDIQMSQGTMGIMIEDKDKYGRYRVEETIKDNVKQASLFLEQYFDVK